MTAPTYKSVTLTGEGSSQKEARQNLVKARKAWKRKNKRAKDLKTTNESETVIPDGKGGLSVTYYATLTYHL